MPKQSKNSPGRKTAIQCTTFRCFRHGDRRCCVGCTEPCDHICYNAPDRCGLSFDPSAADAEINLQIKHLHQQQGLSWYLIGRRLGRSHAYVKYRARQMGLL